MEVSHEDARVRMLRELAGGVATIADVTRALLAVPRHGPAVRALVGAVGAATGGMATLLRRAPDGTYSTVPTIDTRPAGGGRAVSDGAEFAFGDARPDELTLPIPGPGPQPDFVLAIRYGDRIPDECERAALELVASAFALAVRNVALYAESERRRVELLDARAAQAELVARLARDVRGPVTSIVGFARLLEEDGRFAPDAREALAMVRANGERVAEIAADIDLLSRIELAAVEPQWQRIDVGALVATAGAVVDRRSGARILADPDLLGTALGRLIEDGRRPAAPVAARIDDLDDAVVIELTGTGASPAGEAVAPPVGARLAARIVERHGGSFRSGVAKGGWWIRLTLPADPRNGLRRLRVLLVGPNGSDELADLLGTLGFGIEIASSASVIAAAVAASSTDVVVVPIALAAWAGIDRLPADLRRRTGLVALAPAETVARGTWDALVATPALPGDLRAAIYAAAAKARLRRSDDGVVTATN